MRLILTIVFTSLIWSFGVSQKFTKTNKYKVTIDEYTLDLIGHLHPLNGDTAYIRLLDSISELEIFKIPLYSEFFDGYDLETSFGQKITGIDHIVRLTTVYMACCSDESSYYFLVTRNNEYIPLPHYTETFCDGPEPYKEYTFEKDIIRLTHFFPNQENGLDSTKTILTYSLKNEKLIKEK